MTPATAATTTADRRVRYITSLDRVAELSDAERETLAPVARRYAFRLNDYYAGLIDWSDPEDPIRQLVVPARTSSTTTATSTPATRSRTPSPAASSTSTSTPPCCCATRSAAPTAATASASGCS